MTRNGSLTLSDLPRRHLHIVCKPRARHCRCAIKHLIAEHGDAKLSEPLPAIANCPKAKAAPTDEVAADLRNVIKQIENLTDSLTAEPADKDIRD